MTPKERWLYKIPHSVFRKVLAELASSYSSRHQRRRPRNNTSPISVNLNHAANATTRLILASTNQTSSTKSVSKSTGGLFTQDDSPPINDIHQKSPSPVHVDESEASKQQNNDDDDWSDDDNVHRTRPPHTMAIEAQQRREWIEKKNNARTSLSQTRIMKNSFQEKLVKS